MSFSCPCRFPPAFLAFLLPPKNMPQVDWLLKIAPLCEWVCGCLVSCNEHPIQDVFPPRAQCSRGRLRIHYNPDLLKTNERTNDEWIIAVCKSLNFAAFRLCLQVLHLRVGSWHQEFSLISGLYSHKLGLVSTKYLILSVFWHHAVQIPWIPGYRSEGDRKRQRRRKRRRG